MTVRLGGVIASLFCLAAFSPAPALSQARDSDPGLRQEVSKREPSASQLAARERQRKCAAEWKSAKTAGNVETGMKWPKFWSQCNKRLKGGSA
jgi:hypothetical protein